MNYAESLAYLEGLGDEVLEMGFHLDSTRELLFRLGNPQESLPCVLIAGTNGKGSVTRFMDSALLASGLKTARFTSPHLRKLEERITYLGEAIGPDTFAEYISRVKEAVAQNSHTFFEVLTAAAFLFFKACRPEVALLEVGMGGRSDCTNVVSPLLSVITTISLDHEQFLGHELSRIAREKAGILRRGVLGLSAPQTKEAWGVLSREATQVGTEIRTVRLEEPAASVAGDGRFSFAFAGHEVTLGVYGRHQASNAALAFEACQQLSVILDVPIDSGRIVKGLAEAQFPGALSKISSRPALFLDGAHNPQAAEALRDFLFCYTELPRSLIFGCMRDKNIEAILGTLEGAFQRVYLCPMRNKRAASGQELSRFTRPGSVLTSLSEAIQKAFSQSETVVIAGSNYLVGEALEQLEGTDLTKG